MNEEKKKYLLALGELITLAEGSDADGDRIAELLRIMWNKIEMLDRVQLSRARVIMDFADRIEALEEGTGGRQ